MQNVGLAIGNGKLPCLRIDSLHRIDEARRALVVHDKLVAETDVVTRLLKSYLLERLEREAFFLALFFDVDVGEEHGLVDDEYLIGTVVFRPVRVIEREHALKAVLRELRNAEFPHERKEFRARGLRARDSVNHLLEFREG